MKTSRFSETQIVAILKQSERSAQFPPISKLGGNYGAMDDRLQRTQSNIRKIYVSTYRLMGKPALPPQAGSREKVKIMRY